MLSVGSRKACHLTPMTPIIRKGLYYLLGVVGGLIPLVILFEASAPPPPFFLSALALHFDTIMFGIAFLAVMLLLSRPRGHWSHPAAWGIISAAVFSVGTIFALTTAIPF